MDFDPNNVVSGDTISTSGGFDMFLAKYNSADVLQWVKRIGNGGNDIIYNLATDVNDNIYAHGVYATASVDFDQDNVIAGDTISVAGGVDAFIAKYNSSGVLQWVKSIGGTLNENIGDFFVDSSGNVYVSGGYGGGSVDFDQDNVVAGDTHTAVGDVDIFLAKYNSSGTLQWVKSIGDTSQDASYGIYVDENGDAYLVGYFQGTNIDFDTDNVVSGDTISSVGDRDAFIARYNSSGVLQWLKRFGNSGNDQGRDIKLDSSGNIIIAGLTTSTDLDFDPDNVVSGDTDSSNGSFDPFVAKYNSSGVLQWVKVSGGTGLDLGSGFELDSEDSIYYVGLFGESNVDFDRKNVINGDTVSSIGGYDAFVVKYNSSGVLQWLKTAGGSGTDRMIDIVFDSNDDLNIVGYFASANVDFDTDKSLAGDTISTAGGDDIFIAKYSQFNQIANLGSELTADDVSGNNVEVGSLEGLSGAGNTIQINKNGFRISDVVTNMVSDRDWGNVVGDTDTVTGKAVISNVTSAPGTDSTLTLYVPIPSGNPGGFVIVCPNAETLAEVTVVCSGLTVKKESDSDTSKVTINSQQYWKITGLSGTGGLSYQDEDTEVVITGIGSIDNVVNQSSVTYYYTTTKPEIKGTAEAGSTVYFEVGEETYTVVADSAGNYTITLDDPTLVDGDNEIEYYSIDLAGNKSSVRGLTLVIGIDNFPDWLRELYEEEGEDALEEQDGNGEKVAELPETEDTEEENKDQSSIDSDEESEGKVSTLWIVIIVGVGLLFLILLLILLKKRKKNQPKVSPEENAETPETGQAKQTPFEKNNN